MELRIVSKNVELTDGLKSYLIKRLSKLDKFSNRIISGEVSLEEERGRFKGEVILRMKGSILTAKGEGKDPYETVDVLKDRITSQIKKYEDRTKRRR